MILMLPLLLAACLGEEEFQQRYDEELCLWREDCFGDDPEECLNEAEAVQFDPGCEFDRQAAKDCLKGLEKMDCPGSSSGSGLPYECVEVWDCP